MAVVLRALAAVDDPWLDEIWSWQIARTGELFAHSDNNHFLNTLWLWVVGASPNAFIWRLPSVVAGGVTVYVSYLLLGRVGRPHAVIGAALTAVSFPLVYYGSEARGYSLMLAAVLIAIELQLRLLDRPGRVVRLSYWLICALGAMSHAAFFVVFAVLFIWRLVYQSRQPGWVKSIVVEQGGAVLLLAIWWIVFASRTEVGGGPRTNPLEVIGEAMASIVGLSAFDADGPRGIILRIAGGAIVCGFLLFLLHRRLRQCRLLQLLISLTVGYPIVVGLVAGDLQFLRYYLPAVLTGTLLIAVLLGQLWQARQFTLFGLLFCLLLITHAAPLKNLLQRGRDRQVATIWKWTNEHRESEIVATHPFQMKLITDYNAYRAGLTNAFEPNQPFSSVGGTVPDGGEKEVGIKFDDVFNGEHRDSEIRHNTVTEVDGDHQPASTQTWVISMAVSRQKLHRTIFVMGSSFKLVDSCDSLGWSSLAAGLYREDETQK